MMGMGGMAMGWRCIGMGGGIGMGRMPSDGSTCSLPAPLQGIPDATMGGRPVMPVPGFYGMPGSRDSSGSSPHSVTHSGISGFGIPGAATQALPDSSLSDTVLNLRGALQFSYSRNYQLEERCRTFEQKNRDLTLRVVDLEAQLQALQDEARGDSGEEDNNGGGGGGSSSRTRSGRRGSKTPLGGGVRSKSDPGPSSPSDTLSILSAAACGDIGDTGAAPASKAGDKRPRNGAGAGGSQGGSGGGNGFLRLNSPYGGTMLYHHDGGEGERGDSDIVSGRWWVAMAVE